MHRIYTHTLSLLFLGLSLIGLVSTSAVMAKSVEYTFTVKQQQLNISGKKATTALTLNGSIVGPTIEATEGDTLTVHLVNQLPTDSTSIHWHGLLVPADMDGVPVINTPVIPAGSTFSYRFVLKQNGTYWYHSHTNMQEQRGLYGAIVIHPAPLTDQAVTQQQLPVDNEQALLFSDWSDRSPNRILRLLRSGDEWMQIQKGTINSWDKTLAKGLPAVKTRLQDGLHGMPPMDIADVAYDAFLVNGSRRLDIPHSNAKKMRLRLINGSSSSYYQVTWAGIHMQVIASDGQPIQPINTTELLMAVGETYDVLVDVPATGSFELRATAQDHSGSVSTWLGSGEPKPAAAPSIANMHSMIGMQHSEGDSSISHTTTNHATSPTSHDANNHSSYSNAPASPAISTTSNHLTSHVGDAMNHLHAKGDMQGMAGMEAMEAMQHAQPDSTSSGDVNRESVNTGSANSVPAILHLSDLQSTDMYHPPSNQPVRSYTFTLQGDMQRYIWTLNGQTMSEADVVTVKKGERVRMTFVNQSMMHHPMHLHGHFFRVLNGQGMYSPLKHTVDVAPMATVTIEFDAEQDNDWVFHCHILYHMQTGMMRVLHYDNGQNTDMLKMHWMHALHAAKEQMDTDTTYWGEAYIASNPQLTFTLSQPRHQLALNVEADDTHSLTTTKRSQLVEATYAYYPSLVNARLVPQLKLTHDYDRTHALIGAQLKLPFGAYSQILINDAGKIEANLTQELYLLPRIQLALEANSLGHHELMLRYRHNAAVSLAAKVTPDKASVGLGLNF